MGLLTGWVEQKEIPGGLKSFCYYEDGRPVARVDLYADGWKTMYLSKRSNQLVDYEDLPKDITEDEAKELTLTLRRLA